MAQGKNKRIFKARKGAKKRVGDPFAKKEVYEVKAPSVFTTRNVGKTFVNKTQGTKIASDSLKGRVFEANLADLQGNADEMAYRKVKLVVDEVQGKSCLTSFYGLDFTRDWLCSLLRKWQTLIEVNLDVETKDGIRVRLFFIGFTAKRAKQVKKTCYASTAQVKQIRKIIFGILKAEAESNDIHGLVKSIIGEDLNKKIVKQTSHIFPLQNVYVRKVKVIKRPRLDVAKLMEMYKEVPVAATTTEAKPEDEAAKNLLTSELSS
jgi:small subunit ribosomal protein S3Ae